jgi:hypothetical protein
VRILNTQIASSLGAQQLALLSAAAAKTERRKVGQKKRRVFSRRDARVYLNCIICVWLFGFCSLPMPMCAAVGRKSHLAQLSSVRKMRFFRAPRAAKRNCKCALCEGLFVWMSLVLECDSFFFSDSWLCGDREATKPLIDRLAD